MKKIFFSLIALTIFIVAKAQKTDSDTSLHTAAVAVCDCLSKAKFTDKTTQEQMQQAFLSCIFTSAPDLITKIVSSGDDYAKAGEQLGTQLAMEMLKNGCPAFAKIAGSMAIGGDDNEVQMPAQTQIETVESTDGIITKVEEKDFTYITLKTTAGRELTFIYYEYVPGSDEWIKDAVTKLKNKNVCCFLC